MLLIPNFNFSEKIEEAVIKYDQFGNFLQLNCCNFRLKHSERP